MLTVSGGCKVPSVAKVTCKCLRMRVHEWGLEHVTHVCSLNVLHGKPDQ